MVSLVSHMRQDRCQLVRLQQAPSPTASGLARLGVVGIIIDDRSSVARVNEILSRHSEVIIGRMGVPYREKDVNVISLIVDADTDQIG